MDQTFIINTIPHTKKQHSKGELQTMKKLISVIRKSIVKNQPNTSLEVLNDKMILESLLHYDINSINKEILKYIITDVKKKLSKYHKWNTILPESIYKKDVVEKEYFISIDLYHIHSLTFVPLNLLVQLFLNIRIQEIS